MKVQDIEKAMLQLIGEQNLRLALPDNITADDFAENILGFEEVDEADLENEMANNAAENANSTMLSNNGTS